MKAMRSRAMCLLVILAVGHAPSSARASSAWMIVPSPNVSGSGFGNALAAVHVIATNDAWAVGFSPAGGIGSRRALAEHWNGRRWSVTPVAIPRGSSYTALTSVSATSSTDVWAVGYAGFVGQVPERHTLVEHFAGSAWQIVSSPSPGNHSGNDLFGVHAVASDDAWAVGDAFSGGSGQFGGALTLHWNGTRWSIVSNPGHGATLFSVRAISSADVWAVGTLAMHWNGSRWMSVPARLPSGSVSIALQAVVAPSSQDVWAMGQALFNTSEGQFPAALVERLGPTGFTVVPAVEASGLFGAVAIAPNDIWAVGITSVSSAFIEHWNGMSWVRQSNPQPGSFSMLSGVDGGADDDLWAVGAFNSGQGVDATLTELHP